nr:hypothetical protein [Tanacetum cinerariifolium]
HVKVVNEEDEVHDDDLDGEEEYENPFGSSSTSNSGHSSHQHRRWRNNKKKNEEVLLDRSTRKALQVVARPQKVAAKNKRAHSSLQYPLDQERQQSEGACIKKQMFESQMGYVLVVMEESRSRIMEHNPLVRITLEDFKDVIPNEIPTGLPMREVHHCINLVPGSVLPNKAAYRMNLKEHEELQRQVDKILKKVVLQESKSPYVVPALLVPKKMALGVCVWIVGLLTRSPSNIVAIIKYELDPEMSGRRLSRRRVVFMNGFEVDHEKVEAILNWTVPKIFMMCEVFMCLKGSSFQWTKEVQKTFGIVKRKMAEAPVLVLPDLEKIF